MRLNLLLVSLSFIASIAFGQGEHTIVERLNEQGQRIHDLERQLSRVQKELRRRNSKISELNNQISSATNDAEVEMLHEQLKSQKEIADRLQELFNSTKEMLDREIELRREAERREGLAIRQTAEANQRANVAIRERDEAIADLDEINRNSNGFQKAIPYNQRGKENGGAVILEITSTGEQRYSGFRTNGKVDYLFLEISFTVLNEGPNSNIEEIRGYICVYDPYTEKLLFSIPANLELSDVEDNYRTYDLVRPFQPIGREVQMKHSENFTYMFVETRNYLKSSFQVLNASQVCEEGRQLFSLPRNFCDAVVPRP